MFVASEPPTARSRKSNDWFHKLEFKLADNRCTAKWVKTQRVLGQNPTH